MKAPIHSTHGLDADCRKTSYGLHGADSNPKPYTLNPKPYLKALESLKPKL